LPALCEPVQLSRPRIPISCIIMLRAEAAVFTPKDVLAEHKAEKCATTLTEEACSTVAPSPSLSAQSPMLSPFWGFEDASCSPDTMWAAAALYGGYGQDGCGNYMPEFTLPDCDMNDFGDMSGYSRPRAATEPAHKTEFSLNGMEDLQSSLVGLLKGISPSEITCHQDGDSQESTSAGAVSPPPGLVPPPGLEAPPGLGDETPRGAEGTTVAELHARLNKCKTSPLPPGTTTAMLRNIPNKYTQAGLVERLQEAGFRRELDFIYLPIDFKNKCNVGYAFMNFRTAEACAQFAAEFHGSNSREKLPGFNSKKVCEVSAARFQGCDENIRRLQASSVMAELLANPDWLPQLFDINGQAMAFPLTDTSKEAVAASRPSRGRLQRRKGTA